jgi:hypothetical protein
MMPSVDLPAHLAQAQATTVIAQLADVTILPTSTGVIIPPKFRLPLSLISPSARDSFVGVLPDDDDTSTITDHPRVLTHL